MKILQVISYFYPAWAYGGPGKLVYDLSKELAKNNSVSVYTTDALSQDKRRTAVEDPNIKNLHIRVFKNFSNILAFKYKLFLPFMAFRSLKKEIVKYDLIHLHEFFTIFSVLISFFSVKVKVPYLVSAHGTLNSFHLQNRFLTKKIFMRIFGTRIIDNSAGLVAATLDEIREYQLLGVKKEKIFYVQNGINFRQFQKLPQKGFFRKKYRLETDTKLILYLGRINKLKGLNTLVTAFSTLSKEIDLHLVIAGSDDGYLKALKEEAKKLKVLDKIIFPGITAGLSKMEAYVDSDVFVYPSPSEGFSIAVLEAAAAGMPLVITKGCKFPEVEKYKAGIIVEADPLQMHKALKRILTDDRLKKSLSINARELIQNNYTIEAMSSRLSKIYKTLVN